MVGQLYCSIKGRARSFCICIKILNIWSLLPSAIKETNILFKLCTQLLTLYCVSSMINTISMGANKGYSP